MNRGNRWLKNAPVLGGAVLVMLLVFGLIWVIRGFMKSKVQRPERVVQTITVIRPPPPPPETPPPPPPPEKIEQPLDQQKEPEPKPDNTPAPPQPQLGIDASGSAGGDAFGLLARPGGTDLVGSGGSVFAWYTGKIKDAVTQCLGDDTKLHAKKFTVNVRLWIGADGHIKQVRLVSGSGNHDLDGEISSALGALQSLDAAPPIEMPQPVTLQIVGHG